MSLELNVIGERRSVTCFDSDCRSERLSLTTLNCDCLRESRGAAAPVRGSTLVAGTNTGRPASPASVNLGVPAKLRS